MATIKRVGFGQVEPNHLSAKRTGQIYAQLPASAAITILENGQFAKYDYAANEVNYTGEGEWMLVFNEVKLYEDRESYKDFALQAKNFTPGGNITHNGVGPFPGQMTPRLFKTNVGDIYTTNCIGGAVASKDAEYAGIELEVGNYLTVADTGYLTKADALDPTVMTWKVAKVYTMADGQPAVKIVRVA